MAIYCVYHGGNGTGGAIAGSVPSTTDWNNAYTNIQACLTAITEAIGDIICVAHDHNFNYTANYAITSTAFIWIISVDRTNTTLLNPLTGAKETATGAFSATFAGLGYFYGTTFTSGSTGSSAISINSGTTAGFNMHFNACRFELTSTSGGTVRFASGTTNSKTLNFIGCVFKFAGASSVIAIVGTSTSYFKNCSIDAAGTKPNVLFIAGTSSGVTAIFEACDLSWCTALQAISATVSNAYQYIGCLVPATLTSGSHGGIGALSVEMHGCGTATNDYAYGYYKQDGSGIVLHDTGVYLTSGEPFQTTNGGTQNLSLKMIPSANIANAAIGKCFPLYSPWFDANVAATGIKTLTLKVGHSESAVLNSDQIGIEIQYMGDAAHPELTLDQSAPLIGLAGSALTDTAEAWVEPATEVTKTHTLSKTVTINQTGFCRARIVIYKQTTNAVYVHPVLLVS